MKRWLWIGAGLAGVVLLAFAGVIAVIHLGVSRFSAEAVARFPADREAALIRMVECTHCQMQDRNHAVWTLGYVGATRALPLLKRLHDGRRCEHETRLRQHELKKAIGKLERAQQGRITMGSLLRIE